MVANSETSESGDARPPTTENDECGGDGGDVKGGGEWTDGDDLDYVGDATVPGKEDKKSVPEPILESPAGIVNEEPREMNWEPPPEPATETKKANMPTTSFINFQASSLVIGQPTLAMPTSYRLSLDQLSIRFVL